MGRLSFATKDMSKGGGFGLQGGRYRVVDIRSLVYQPAPPAKGGEQASPFTCIEFDVIKLNEDWKESSEEVIQHQFPLAFAVSEDGRMKLKARPAKAAGPDDENPKDLTDGKDTIQEMVGIEGNSVHADDGFKLWDQAPWAIFATSLEAKAFKAEVNAAGYLPAYVGLEFACENRELPKPKNWKKEQPPTALVCTNIHVFPWDAKKSGKTGGAKKEESAGAAKANGAADGAGSGGAVEGVYAEVLEAFIKANKGATMTKAEFKKKLSVALMAKKEIGVKGAAGFTKANIDSEEGLMGLALTNGFEADGDKIAF